MPGLIPPRPRYQRERILIGYPILLLFVLLFAVRFCEGLLPLPTDRLWFKSAVSFGVFFLPALLFLILRGPTPPKRLRMFAPRLRHYPFLFSAFFVLISGGMLLSMLCGGTSSLGNSATSFEEIATSPISLLWAIPSLAILPALLEELFFRGIVVTEYERRGAIRAVLMSALLFALCHFDLRNLPVYFFSGLLFALVLLATNSLFATVILHAVYNTASLFAQRYLNALYEFTGNLELFIFLLVVVFLVASIFFCRSAAKLYGLRAKAAIPNPRRAVPRNVQLYTTLDALCDPPFIICLLIAIAGFILLN